MFSERKNRFRKSFLLVKLKQTVRGHFFENKLLLQPNVIFDSESNDRNFSSLAPPRG